MSETLERDLQEMLQRKFGEARVPPAAPPDLIRRTRRRQARTVAMAALVAVALVAGSVGTVLALTHQGGTLPAGNTTTTTINGISIEYPIGWFAADPADIGLEEGPGNATVPRIVLVLSNRDPSDSTILGCPGPAEKGAGAVLMTVQEMALDEGLPGWPARTRPFAVGATGDSACYPDWAFSQAQWTAVGRSFDGRLGIAPDATDADGAALLDAYDSMSFEPGNGKGPKVLARGTAAGHDWTLILSLNPDGADLGLEYDRGGSGTGGFTVPAVPIEATSHTFRGNGDASVETVVFGAVTAQAARAVVLPEGVEATLTANPYARFNLFWAQVEGTPTRLVLEDDNGNRIGGTSFGPGGPAPSGLPTSMPTETPPEPHTSPSALPNVALPEPANPQRGGTYWAVYVAVGQSEDDQAIVWSRNRLEIMGAIPYTVGDRACDQGSEAVLPGDARFRVAVYYEQQADAHTFEKAYQEAWSGDRVVGVAEVQTYCLD